MLFTPFKGREVVRGMTSGKGEYIGSSGRRPSGDMMSYDLLADLLDRPKKSAKRKKAKGPWQFQGIQIWEKE